MAFCSKCKEKIGFPMSCKFCGEDFCDNCALPENHECSGLVAYKERIANERKNGKIISIIYEPFSNNFKRDERKYNKSNSSSYILKDTIGDNSVKNDAYDDELIRNFNIKESYLGKLMKLKKPILIILFIFIIYSVYNTNLLEYNTNILESNTNLLQSKNYVSVEELSRNPMMYYDKNRYITSKGFIMRLSNGYNIISYDLKYKFQVTDHPPVDSNICNTGTLTYYSVEGRLDKSLGGMLFSITNYSVIDCVLS